MFLAKIARILGTRQKRAACEENRRLWWQQQIEALYLLLGPEEKEVAFKDSWGLQCSHWQHNTMVAE